MILGDGKSPAEAKRSFKQTQGSARNNRDNSTDIFTILSLWAEKNERELRPSIKHELGGVFYDLDGFSIAYDKLKVAEKKDLLKASGSTSFSSCPKCQSHILQAQLVCPDCKFQSIFKSDLLIHYECQNSGPVSDFQSNGHDGYFCPKCKKELKRVGIDYGNPGIGFKCSNCAKVFQFPLVLSNCDAGHTSKIDELDLKSYPNYVVGDNARGLSKILADSRALQEALKGIMISSEVMVQLVGVSGMNHLIPLLINVSGKQIAVEFVSEESDIEQIILQLLLKSADLEKIRMIIISRSHDLVNQITQIVNPQKVKVFEAADMGSLSDRIAREAVG